MRGSVLLWKGSAGREEWAAAWDLLWADVKKEPVRKLMLGGVALVYMSMDSLLENIGQMSLSNRILPCLLNSIGVRKCVILCVLLVPACLLIKDGAKSDTMCMHCDNLATVSLMMTLQQLEHHILSSVLLNRVLLSLLQSIGFRKDFTFFYDVRHCTHFLLWICHRTNMYFFCCLFHLWRTHTPNPCEWIKFTQTMPELKIKSVTNWPCFSINASLQRKISMSYHIV